MLFVGIGDGFRELGDIRERFLVVCFVFVCRLVKLGEFDVFILEEFAVFKTGANIGINIFSFVGGVVHYNNWRIKK